MGFFDRLSNGWKISMNSFKVLKANRQLIIFPILSGLSLLFIMGSFVVATLAAFDWDVDNIGETGTFVNYLILFVYYVVNYFIIVFFNMALIHCTSLYFKGEEVTIKKGINFSISRIGSIFAWAVFAACVGAILRLIQENFGTIGKIVTGLVGIAWSITTFFVVPVIAYENLGPVGAFKRSAQLMKQKWGEGIGAGFSFGLIQLIGVAVAALAGYLVGITIHPFAGIAVAVLAILLLSTIVSAAQTIFISSVYHNVTGDPVEHYNQQFIDNLFEFKK
jgi:hypothetical protein